ncbi:MAG: S8 family serine peptidase [Verrucomicrobiales bacterium]
MKITINRRTAAVLAGVILVLPRESVGAEWAPNEVIVRFKDGVSVEQMGQRAAGRASLRMKKEFRVREGGGGKVRRGLFHDAGKSVEELLEEFGNNELVEYAEPNLIRRKSALPDDPGFGLLWGLQNSGQSVDGKAGTAGADVDYEDGVSFSRPDGTEVVVAVADSGISIRHPDLAANVWVNPGEVAGNGIDDDGNGYVDDVHGYDFADGSGEMEDGDGHGTHVAGTIGAVTGNAVGIAGVCDGVKLMALNVESDDGYIYSSEMIEALDYAVDAKYSGVNVVAVNASFGGPSFTQAEYDAIASLNAAGIVLCAAAGNEAADNDASPTYPANYDLANVISVAAVDQDNSLASFSNFGAGSVDLGAPGENIYSTLPLNLLSYTAELELDGTSYTVANLVHSGTTPTGGLSGTLVDCGLGYPEEFPAGVSGNIAFIERGELFFSEKVGNAADAGAIAAVIYDHTSGTAFGWTLGGEADWIPALQLSLEDGEEIAALLPVGATVTITGNQSLAYQLLDGTSMATPHVTGAVAFAAANFPDESAGERVARILDHVTPVAGLDGLVGTAGVLNLSMIVNTDGDGLADWWEEESFAGLAEDGAADTDGDGFSDECEFVALTDPLSAADFPRLTAVGDEAGSGFALSFEARDGRFYQVRWSEDLEAGSWQNLGGTTVGDGSVVEVWDPDAGEAARRFYQLKVERK